MSNKIGVFIIESRKIKEEFQGKKQGLILTEIMTLIGIKSEYRYIRTQKELDEMISQYYESDFRYLHFSMHGVSNKGGKPVSKFSLSLEQVSYDKFCEAIIKKGVGKDGQRRLFISACNVLDEIATQFAVVNNSFISIVAPSTRIRTSIAPLVWATFYHDIFTINKEFIKNSDIKENLNRICSFFKVKFNGYFRKKNDSNQYEIYSFPKQDK